MENARQNGHSRKNLPKNRTTALLNTSRPQTGSARLAEAERLLAAKAYKPAHALCLEELNRNPESAQAYYLLGILTADHGNHAKAVELFTRATLLDTHHAPAFAQLARSEIARSRREEALRAANAAAALSPPDAHTLDTLGVVYSRAGLHARATPFYACATRTAPDVANYHYNHGAALQFLGDMAAAREAYRKCLEIDPLETRALSSIVQITRQSEQENMVSELEAAFEATRTDPDDALRIGHALAKAHEDLGHSAEALDWLHRAKAAKRATTRHDPSADAAVFAAARSLPAQLANISGYASAEPIFIVGMPRTGTTLVDRILSNHSEVTSAGELTDFGLLLKRMAATGSNHVLDPETLIAASGVDLAELGKAYMDGVSRTQRLFGRFIDKMPLNAFYAPIILAALPNARVICLRRHPADTVLSNYRQMFATSFSYYNYAYSLAATAHYYVGFDRMMADFASTLPSDRYCDVHYENVVADIEGETRRLLDFCGLPFEAACLDFHENTAPVATASAAQVRQPLYMGSVARWKRYAPGMAEALDILEAAGCISAGERTC
ncbi:MAG: sulfotransferase [Alphaproteobacteria bacterium]|uniref:tetratricopeptide repeat-containing sulfotransferase family protein n=1 Tax=Hyphomonas sp. BRH_c22 TaxID=1629710 RepID=UPI000B249599|nr:tetratricopeptide repeat-containing sulfotransferase family protein [Hyphomonas sp. BRH_c22]MBU2532065.1 sulfotransferase [Alphaproteobacteria bacterium]